MEDQHKGFNSLAQVLQEKTKQISNENTQFSLDIGTITKNMGLVTHTFPLEIPQSDYLVLRQLTLGSTGSTLTSTDSSGDHSHGDAGNHTHVMDQLKINKSGKHNHKLDSKETDESGEHEHSFEGGEIKDGGSHSHPTAGEHSHNVLLPDKMRSIQPGDRVLVAWVSNDAIVLDIILPAKEV